MRRPTIRLLATLATLALFVAACGSDASTETTDGTGTSEETTATTAGTNTTEASEDTTATTEATGDTSGDEPFTIAIVAPSASNDLAFTQSIVDGVDRLDNVEVAITDGTFVVDDAAAAIRDYAEQGYDLVIAHGSQYGGSLEEIAPEFPDVSFAWGTAADTFGLDNVFSYEAASDEGGYVMGVMAAALSESGTIGVVGPIEVGDAKLYVDGFVNGVTAQNPSATTNVNYIGDFSNVALASEAAQSMIGSGADVLTGTAQMTVGAIGVAAQDGVPWFGTQSNQTSVAPEIVVASQVYHWEVVLEQIVESVKSGVLGGEIYTIDLANGGLVIEYNDGFDLPDDIKALGDDAAAGIADGSIETGA